MNTPPTSPITVTIAGSECRLRYPIKSMRAIEDELGHAVLKLAYMASEANITIKALESVLYHGLRGADDARPRPEVEQLIEADYTGALAAFGAGISAALGTDDKAPESTDSNSEGDAPGE